MAFEGKVIAVTGGGQGIGLATAKLLASRGASLTIADSNEKTLADVEKDFSAKGWPIHTAALDIRNASQVDDWINAAVKKFGRLDGAVNAAGIVGKFYGQRPLAEQDDDDWNLVLGVNVNGVMYSLRAELRHLVDGGSIVNISSEQGSKGGPGCAAYSTSKHAVLGLTKCAAHDYGARGIRVNAVAPGGTYGPLMTAVAGDAPPPAANPLRKYGKPEEVAAMIAWLLGPESTHCSGELFRVDGGGFA
ncbi:NAD(P)-binding protein [Lepidopterella palustris CBS 459.81]|uniref:NAD(P)-binding protein n=1 Tax=Lepidopterella palustris CBS 459.81 TaxID=1314670 RepID=A0A8E2J9N9_9PEZI|nr:NAD(P)-binding protein [Lepidopterella palustris CBS 459.81]